MNFYPSLMEWMTLAEVLQALGPFGMTFSQLRQRMQEWTTGERTRVIELLIERGYLEYVAGPGGPFVSSSQSVASFFRVQVTEAGRVAWNMEVRSQQEDMNRGGCSMKHVEPDEVLMAFDQLNDKGLIFAVPRLTWLDTLTDQTEDMSRLVYPRYFSTMQVRALSQCLPCLRVRMRYTSSEIAKKPKSQRDKIPVRDTLLYNREAVRAILKQLKVQNQRRYWRAADGLELVTFKEALSAGGESYYHGRSKIPWPERE